MIDDEHWSLWARWKREGDLTMSFRTTNVLYTPPRRLPVDDAGGRPLLDGCMPTDEDYRLIGLIEQGLDALRRVDHEGAMFVLQWHGAYPGAPIRRGDRIVRMGINPREASRAVEKRKLWVSGWVDGFERSEARLLSALDRD